MGISGNDGVPARRPMRALLGKPLRLLGMVVAGLALLLSFVVPSAVAISPPPPPTVSKVADSASALKLSWSAVTGAKGYRVQYSTSETFSSPKYVPASTSSAALTDTSATIGGLTTGTTYYFRVAVVDPSSLTVLSGSYSKPVSAAATYPYTAPGDIALTSVTKSSMVASWKAINGAPGYRVRVYTSKGTKYVDTATNSVALKGLPANTTHYIRAFVNQGTTRLSADSPENTATTSTYSLASPDGLEIASQAPSSVGLAWTGPTLPSGAQYMVSYALDAAQTQSRVTRGPFASPSATVSGLTSNTTFYAVAYVVDKDKKQISGWSEFVVAKTLVPRGTITGTTKGVTGSDLTAAAYTTGGELADQTTVGSDGEYSLSVRPGDYRVQIAYTGTGNYASAWARAGKDGGRMPSEASLIKVATNKTTTAPTVTIHTGGVVSGVVKDGSGQPVRDVDITAMTFMSDEREVEVVGRSGSDGGYAIRGLPDGKHWLRYIYSGDGFTNRSVEVVITQGKITSVRVSTSPKPVTAPVDDPFTSVNVRLDNADFRKRYGAYISGSAYVGRTLSARATPWLAGSYPTTRASMSLQWKRNGAAIKGATRSTYKLTSADRGKRITVTATARRYGYNTGSTTSKATSTVR